jgi:hypothetical protein
LSLHRTVNPALVSTPSMEKPRLIRQEVRSKS